MGTRGQSKGERGPSAAPCPRDPHTKENHMKNRSAVRTRAAAVVAGLVALAAFGVVHPQIGSTSPVSLTLNYTCPFPLIGDQAMSVTITSDIPASLQVGTPSGQFDIT